MRLRVASSLVRDAWLPSGRPVRSWRWRHDWRSSRAGCGRNHRQSFCMARSGATLASLSSAGRRTFAADRSSAGQCDADSPIQPLLQSEARRYHKARLTHRYGVPQICRWRRWWLYLSVHTRGIGDYVWTTPASLKNGKVDLVDISVVIEIPYRTAGEMMNPRP